MSYNFESIMALCKEHEDEIFAGKNLSSLLCGRQVRYIDPLGHFNYTTFGNFYFRSMGVMMLITKDHEMTPYHQPDILSNSLISTVPVIYAGIETGLRDAQSRKIFTGDVVTPVQKGIHSGMVRWMKDAKYPSIMGDNCDYILDHNEPLEINGNVFFDIVCPEDYDIFDYYKFVGHNPVPYGPIPEDIHNELLNKIKGAPSFKEGTLKPQRKRQLRIYAKSISELKFKDSDIIIAFCEDNDRVGDKTLYIDAGVVPDKCNCKCITIPINTGNPDWGKIEKTIDNILLDIHNNPETRYALCDYRQSLFVPIFHQEFTRIFRKAAENCLANLALPFSIANEYILDASLGKD